MSAPDGGDDPVDLPAVEVVPAGPLGGALAAPASKSVTNRLLVIAALAEGESRLSGPLRSDDTTVMRAALSSLGVALAEAPDGTLVVSGSGGRLSAPATVVSAGLSGTTLRFLAAVALLVDGTLLLDGEPALRRRPILPLVHALESLGAEVATADGRPPLRISSRGLRGGPVTVDAAESSQFATSLLLVAPYAGSDLELEIRHLGAAGYVELTVEAMSRWGAGVVREGPDRYVVAAGRHYRARSEEAEYDASAAGHLFALAVATGGSVTVTNAVATTQPDAALAGMLAEMGAAVAGEPGGGVTVGRPGALRGIDVDISPMPDQLPTLAVLGALAQGTTRLRNVAVARGHETDRVAAVSHELAKLGADVEVEPDALVVRGGRALHGGVVETYDDHRMAMAFSSLAAAVPGVVIVAPACVRKTYPAYWRDAGALGLRWRRPEAEAGLLNGPA